MEYSLANIGSNLSRLLLSIRYKNDSLSTPTPTTPHSKHIIRKLRCLFSNYSHNKLFINNIIWICDGMTLIVDNWNNRHGQRASLRRIVRIHCQFISIYLSFHQRVFTGITIIIVCSANIRIEGQVRALSICYKLEHGT